MDIKNLVLSDEALNLIDSGAWVGDLPGAPGLELKVRGLNSVSARAAFEAERVAARLDNDGEPLTEEQSAAVTNRVLGKVILLDWRGLTDNGEPVKYKKETAQKWINSRNGETLALLVLNAARKLDAQSYKFVEVITKK